MKKKVIAKLSIDGRYTRFSWDGYAVTFLHGKDLVKYLAIKEWDAGYLVVQCQGHVKGEYEDYIDLAYILSNLYMDPSIYLNNVEEVQIA